MQLFLTKKILQFSVREKWHKNLVPKNSHNFSVFFMQIFCTALSYGAILFFCLKFFEKTCEKNGTRSCAKKLAQKYFGKKMCKKCAFFFPT